MYLRVVTYKVHCCSKPLRDSVSVSIVLESSVPKEQP